MSHFDQADYAVFRERLAVIQRTGNRVELLMKQVQEKLTEVDFLKKQEREKLMEVDLLMKQEQEKLMEVNLLQFRLGMQAKSVQEELQDLGWLMAERRRRLYASSGPGSQLESCDYDYLMPHYLDTVSPETCDGPILYRSPYKQRATEMIHHDSDYTSNTDSVLLRRYPSPWSPENWSLNEFERFLSEGDGEAEVWVDEEPKRRRRNTL
ncbi:uncharacterized protein [Nothobranchius furzeri]|uniref:LOC107394067-like protein n=1 Tax=Nothobranchius furzeri TaxID=105023 RepID=A0A9D3B8E0_NOTFU|nr:uncharacterized protein LOC107394067 [Nothobranchius furzeri]KAF7200467.1 putative LOC107394067-like protein [Nothobranchius furzeri]